MIDAAEGVQENSRRHGYMVSMLGIRQLAVVVNKMDLVDWDRAVYDRIVREYGAFLDQVGIRPSGFIPVSGRGGDNIADRSANLPWYDGPTVLERPRRVPERAGAGEPAVPDAGAGCLQIH